MRTYSCHYVSTSGHWTALLSAWRMVARITNRRQDWGTRVEQWLERKQCTEQIWHLFCQAYVPLEARRASYASTSTPAHYADIWHAKKSKGPVGKTAMSESEGLNSLSR